jgi:hypothetical protein
MAYIAMLTISLVMIMIGGSGCFYYWARATFPNLKEFREWLRFYLLEIGPIMVLSIVFYVGISILVAWIGIRALHAVGATLFNWTHG